jgi:NAD(P)-dependent dehydrogenase (short-subunit alcohol dehydrogenase family)
MSTISLVTGGNRGIGREVCRQLAERGHTVLPTARSADARSAATDATETTTPLRANHDREQFWAHSTANCSRS